MAVFGWAPEFGAVQARAQTARITGIRTPAAAAAERVRIFCMTRNSLLRLLG
jgi:hypothetical protein